MRAMSRLIRLMGRISGDEDTFALLALVLDLARFGDTLAWWRHAQDRWHQAEAARVAAHALRAWHAAGVRPGPGQVAPPPVVANEPLPEQQGTHSSDSTTRRRGTAR
jgi:hypothetical protein